MIKLKVILSLFNELPIEPGRTNKMVNDVTKLNYDGKEIILIATAHVSQESVDLVKRVINEEQPDSICIELDDKRFENIQNPKAWENTDIIQVIKSKRVGFLLANLLLSSYQKKIASKLNVNVGGEMLQGIHSAEETGATLVLADRDIQTTFMRIWRQLTFTGKCKLIFSLIFTFDEDDSIDEDNLQEIFEGDLLESMLADIHKKFPTIGDVLITERDQFLAEKIKNAPGEKVVAILGAAHVPGVSKQIYQKVDLEAINTVPPKKSSSKVIGWGISLIIIGLLIYAFCVNIETGLRQLSVWVLWNSGLSALFTLLALGHPLSILTSFVMAPITSANPLLACGWFAGLVQAHIQKPTVQDAQNIQTDILSFKGFFRNKLLKVLLVVIMSNIGSAIGTFVAGANIIGNLV